MSAPTITSSDQADFNFRWNKLASLDQSNHPDLGDLLVAINSAISGGGLSSVTAPLVNTSGDVSIPKATAGTDGYLFHTDWSTFNNKAPTANPTFTNNLTVTLDNSTGVFTAQDVATANQLILANNQFSVLNTDAMSNTGSLTMSNASFEVALNDDATGAAVLNMSSAGFAGAFITQEIVADDGTTGQAKLTPTAYTMSVQVVAPQITNPPVVATPVAGAVTVDWSASAIQSMTLAATTTITYSHAVAGQTLLLTITAGGSYTVVFPTQKYQGGAQAAQTASGTDLWSIYYDGTNYWATVSQGYA